MASTADHIAARNDTDLLQRLVAAAEQAGIDGAQAWVEANRGGIIAADITVNGEQTTVTDVYAYKVATYTPQPRPGEDPAAVTDAHLSAAIQAVREPTA